MAKNKRKPRLEIDPEKHDKLKPIDVFALGTENDPCFGKHHNLKAEECIDCGDSEFCAIVTAQNLHKNRLKVEAEQSMKDLDEAEEVELEKSKKAKRLIQDYIDGGLKKTKIILKVSRETNLTKDRVKELYNQM